MKKLEPLYRRSMQHLTRLSALTDQLSSSVPLKRESDRIASHICIETLNLLAEFNRSYYLLALQRSQTRSGNLHSTMFPRGTSIEFALRSINMLRRRSAVKTLRRIDEPSWHTKSVFLKIVRLSKVSSEPQVVAAVSLRIRVLEDLPVARNFFAHRNEETAQKCCRLGGHYMLPSTHPSVMLASPLRGRPVRLLEDWIAELEIFVDTMTQ